MPTEKCQQRIQPIRNRLYFDFYNKNVFTAFIERRKMHAEYYGRKLLQNEAIYSFESICPESADFYYQMVTNFMFEKQVINFDSHNVLDKSIWTDLYLFEPKIAKTRRCMWHETIPEERFLMMCQNEDDEIKLENQKMKVIDCSGAIVEWKMIQHSKHRLRVPICKPLEYYKLNESRHMDQNVKINFIKKSISELDFNDIGQTALVQMEKELKDEIIQKLLKLQNLQVQKECFQKLGQDTALLNRRCLPLINEALNTNQKALRVKEFKDDETQVDFWEVEWAGDWSNEWVQTDE